PVGEALALLTPAVGAPDVLAAEELALEAEGLGDGGDDAVGDGVDGVGVALAPGAGADDEEPRRRGGEVGPGRAVDVDVAQRGVLDANHVAKCLVRPLQKGECSM